MSLVLDQSRACLSLIWYGNLLHKLGEYPTNTYPTSDSNGHSLVVDIEMSLISQFSLPLCDLFLSTPVASGFTFWEAYSSVAHFSRDLHTYDNS